MRLKKVPYARSFLEQQANVYFLTEKTSTPFHFSEGEQVEVEIGTGKGNFLLTKAEKNPHIHYVAIEKYDSVLIRAVEKNLEKQTPLENITFVLGDAKYLPLLFAPKSIDVLYLNFSDPWPKTRHAKRRLTFDSKLALYEEKLKDGGHLEMKTDNQGLFEYSLVTFANNQWKFLELSLDLYATEKFETIKEYQTEYEQKFIGKGQRIYYVAVTKESEVID